VAAYVTKKTIVTSWQHMLLKRKFQHRSSVCHNKDNCNIVAAYATKKTMATSWQRMSLKRKL